MKSTPDAITSAKLLDTVTGQAWVITQYTTQSNPGTSDYAFAIIQCRKASASAFDPKWKLSTIG